MREGSAGDYVPEERGPDPIFGLLKGVHGIWKISILGEMQEFVYLSAGISEDSESVRYLTVFNLGVGNEIPNSQGGGDTTSS